MRDIKQLFIYEARKKKEDEGSEPVVVAGEVQNIQMPEQFEKEFKGKPAEKNESDGLFAVDEPTDDDVIDDGDFDDGNKEWLMERIRHKKPFMILGRAGWGKTSIIKSIAKKCGRTVLTVYLDKAEKSDLGGIPVAETVKGGGKRTTNALPAWAAYMLARPEKQFLLFFDEMNQAPGDVQSALMPIILEKEICNIKFNNFIVGAAGNYEDENGAVDNDMNGALFSRFGGILDWESDTDETWDEAFKYMHKKYDSKIGPDGKEFINKLRNYAFVFWNPREVEQVILDRIEQVLEGDEIDKKLASPKNFLKNIKMVYRLTTRRVKLDGDIEEGRGKKEEVEKAAEELATLCSTYCKNDGSMSSSSSRSGRGRASSGGALVHPEILEIIKEVLAIGYSDLPSGPKMDAEDKKFVEDMQKKYGKDKSYIGVSLENVCNPDIVVNEDGQPFTKEQISAIRAIAAKENWKIRYRTNAEIRGDQYMVPAAV